MLLRPRLAFPIPEDTANVARAIFPENNLACISCPRSTSLTPAL